MEVKVSGVPVAALPILYRQLESFGSKIVLEDNGRGICEHFSGTMHFDLVGDVLTVRVVKDAGHFPKFLILGGIKQTIQEAVEMALQEAHAAA